MNDLKYKVDLIRRIRQQRPDVYRQVVARMQTPKGLSGLGITVEEMLAEQNAFAEPTSSGTNWSAFLQDTVNKFLTTAQTIAPAVLSVQQGKACIDINIQRAKSGLNPIDCSSANIGAPVTVGVSPDLKMFLYAALGIGAIYLLMRKR